VETGEFVTPALEGGTTLERPSTHRPDAPPPEGPR
jgi:hypothetical protein